MDGNSIMPERSILDEQSMPTPIVATAVSALTLSYKDKSVLALATTQMGIGSTIFICQVVLIVISSPLHAVGQGIWCGVFVSILKEYV